MSDGTRPDQDCDVYLDNAGAALSSPPQLDAVHVLFTSAIYGNPHSTSPSSLRSSEAITTVRRRILRCNVTYDHLRNRADIAIRYFNTSEDEYDVVFTHNCTAALRLLADSFQFDDETV